MANPIRGRGLVRALGVTCVVLAALTGALLIKITGGSQSPRADEAERRPAPAAIEPNVEAELRGNIARLERRIAALAAETGARAHEPAPRGEEEAAPVRAPTPAPSRPVSVVEQREQGARALQTMYEALDRRLETEAPDPAWRPEADVGAALRSLPSAPRELSVRCVATFCRVELERVPPLGRDDLAVQLAALAPFADGTTYRQDPDNPSRLTLYVQRPGHLLADVTNDNNNN